jgi:hypothetical protein
VADYLRDGIYELRPTFGGIHYRILYFFHGHEANRGFARTHQGTEGTSRRD